MSLYCRSIRATAIGVALLAAMFAAGCDPGTPREARSGPAYEPAKRPQPAPDPSALAAKAVGKALDLVVSAAGASGNHHSPNKAVSRDAAPVLINSVFLRKLTPERLEEVAARSVAAGWLRAWSLYPPTLAGERAFYPAAAGPVPYAPLPANAAASSASEPMVALDFAAVADAVPVEASTLMPLAWLTDQLHHFYAEADVVALTDAQGNEPTPRAFFTDEVVVLREHVLALEEEVRSLRDIVESHYGLVIGGLQEENARLRDELQRLSDLGSSGSVPRPARSLVEETARDDEQVVTASRLPGDDARYDRSTANYEVVDEWGRTPADAASLGDSVSTLKGLVVVVPPGTGRQELEELGRSLRADYADYDNIHIEVFDDENAARIYAEQQVTDPQHRVLRVTKHENSGQDAIFYTGDGIPVPVAF